MTQNQTPRSYEKHPAWERLLDQLEWYDSRSARCQKYYKILKFTQIALAVGVPVISHFETGTKWLVSVSGGLIALIEGVQHMNQYASLWVTYRSTAEHLKHEKFLFLSSAGPYRDLDEEEKMITLAERVEELISTEHAKWVRGTERQNKEGKKGA